MQTLVKDGPVVCYAITKIKTKSSEKEKIGVNTNVFIKYSCMLANSSAHENYVNTFHVSAIAKYVHTYL